MHHTLILFLLFLTITDATVARSSDLTELAPGLIIGENRAVTLAKGESLVELARNEGLGFATVQEANPELDPWLPPEGSRAILSTFAVLPEETSPGITINLAELRLYHVLSKESGFRVTLYPIGIGSDESETPTGRFSIRSKIKKPWWTPPSRLRRERKLPRRVAPGPENPLGDYWMAISHNGIGIHGTNEPFGVGRRVSHGCIRLYNDDVAEIFSGAEKGTPVHIVYQPYKVGIRSGALFLEAHPDYQKKISDPTREIQRQITAVGWKPEVSDKAILQVVNAALGIPRVIAQTHP